MLTLTSMIQNLQALVSRTVSPFEPVVLSVTHIEAGATWNVLPQNGFFEGTIRCFNPDLQKRLKADFIRIVEHTAENFGAKATIIWDQTPPVTYNDPELAGVFAFIGSNGAADAPDLHHDSMTIDDAAFQVSVPYYVENALFLLKHYKK